MAGNDETGEDSRAYDAQHRGLITVWGTQAAEFLQAVLPVHAGTMDVGDAVLTALLAPRGVVVSLFYLVRVASDAFVLDGPARGLEELGRALSGYRLGYRGVSLAYAADGPEYPALRVADPRHRSLPARMYRHSEVIVQPCFEASQMGLPADSVVVLGRDLPQAVGLWECGGLDLGRGCFVGQEVVIRVHHRGKLKSRLFPVRLEPNDVEGSVVLPRAIVDDQGRVVGSLRWWQDGRGVAMLPLVSLPPCEPDGGFWVQGDRVIRVRRQPVDWHRLDSRSPGDVLPLPEVLPHAM